MLAEHLGTLVVAAPSDLREVRIAIEFDRQTQADAIEVDDEVANAMLSSKLEIFEPTVSQTFPESSLCVRLIHPKFTLVFAAGISPLKSHLIIVPRTPILRSRAAS